MLAAGVRRNAANCVGVPQRRRWDPVALEDPLDGRGANPVAEFGKLVLDSAFAS